jgi:hypothetical protein
MNRVCARVERSGGGYDVGSHRDVPPGILISGGPTVDVRS